MAKLSEISTMVNGAPRPTFVTGLIIIAAPASGPMERLRSCVIDAPPAVNSSATNRSALTASRRSVTVTNQYVYL